jgi:hypothetical protein
MKISLPTGRATTRLGFGCAFPGSVSKRGAGQLLDAAFDAGIRHFDVAPSYVGGVAEARLGDFLKRHQDRVTVTTKYGILPPAVPVRVARAVLRPALRRLRRLRSAAHGLARSAPTLSLLSKAAFTAYEARFSLARSLQALGLDKIDIFLMHEPTVSDLSHELLEFLRESVAADRIGVFGVGGDAARGPDLYARSRAFCDVMQLDWRVFPPILDYPVSFRIHYWVLSRELRAVHTVLAARPEICGRWSVETDVNLADIRALTDIVLKASLSRHPNSIVLFTSSNPENIVRNVRVVEEAGLEASARRFCELLADEGARLVSDAPETGRA